MKEDDVVTAAALILQESTDSEKCRGAEQLCRAFRQKAMRMVESHCVCKVTKCFAHNSQHNICTEVSIIWPANGRMSVFSSSSVKTLLNFWFFSTNLSPQGNIQISGQNHVFPLLLSKHSLASWRRRRKVDTETKIGIKNKFSFRYNYLHLYETKRPFDYQTLHVVSVAGPVSCSLLGHYIVVVLLVCDCYRHTYCHLIRGHPYLCDRT